MHFCSWERCTRTRSINAATVGDSSPRRCTITSGKGPDDGATSRKTTPSTASRETHPGTNSMPAPDVTKFWLQTVYRY